MKCGSVLGLLFAVSFNVGSTAWFTKRDKQKTDVSEERPFTHPLFAATTGLGADTTTQLKALSDSLRTANATELFQFAEEGIDGLVVFLSDKKKRQEISTPEFVNAVLEQVPFDIFEIPEAKEVFGAFAAHRGDTATMDPKLFAKTMNKVLDRGLAHAKKCQTFFKHPAQRETLLAPLLAQFDESEKKQFVELLQSPQAMLDAIKEFVAPGGMLNHALSGASPSDPYGIQAAAAFAGVLESDLLDDQYSIELDPAAQREASPQEL